MHTIPNNFLGLPEPYSRREKAKFVILPIPYDATASYSGGTRLGPQAIITASQQVEFYDDELASEPYKFGVCTLDALEPNRVGPEAMCKDVFSFARRVVREGKIPIALGGEHSITSALVRAVMTRHKKLSVLQIDAHGDLRDSYQGTPYSHACVMRRIHELGAKIVPVGIRAISKEEANFIRRESIPVIRASECQASDTWFDRALAALSDFVYITIDIDGFDPAYAPGTGTPEPGGLNWYDVTRLLRQIAEERTVVGFDVVEVAPIPGSTATEFLAAKLIYKLIGYVSKQLH